MAEGGDRTGMAEGGDRAGGGAEGGDRAGGAEGGDRAGVDEGGDRAGGAEGGDRAGVAESEDRAGVAGGGYCCLTYDDEDLRSAKTMGRVPLTRNKLSGRASRQECLGRAETAHHTLGWLHCTSGNRFHLCYHSQIQEKPPLPCLAHAVGVSHPAQLSVLKRPLISPHKKPSSLLELTQLPQECFKRPHLVCPPRAQTSGYSDMLSTVWLTEGAFPGVRTMRSQ